MTPEEAIVILDTLIKPERLSTIQEQVFRRCWEGNTYQEIAESCGYDADYIRVVGSQLWQKLSLVFGEKITKNNFRAVLRQQLQNIPEQKQGKVEVEFPKGVVPLNSKFYIERINKSLCYETILQPGSLLRIKAPIQMGKTSLMVRTLERARQSDFDTVALSFQKADANIFKDLERLLKWFCTAIARELRLEGEDYLVDNYWDSNFGSKSNCTDYFQERVLSARKKPLVLALDRVDEVFRYLEVADDFFSMLRSWYEEAAYGTEGSEIWQNLRLIIIHSTEVYIPLDTNKSPFNVGVAIELEPFNSEQVYSLARIHGLELSQQMRDGLMQLLGGHPFLVRLALYNLALEYLTWEELLQTAATEAGIYRSHLHQLLGYLQEDMELMVAYEQVIQSVEAVELEQMLAFKLHSMGLISLSGNSVMPSCELYRQYFLGQIKI